MAVSFDIIENKYKIFLGDLHKELINLLYEHERLTRSEVVKLINKPRTTIYDNLMDLVEVDVVYKRSMPSGLRGRPNVYFMLKDRVCMPHN